MKSKFISHSLFAIYSRKEEACPYNFYTSLHDPVRGYHHLRKYIACSVGTGDRNFPRCGDPEAFILDSTRVGYIEDVFVKAVSSRWVVDIQLEMELRTQK